MDESILFEIFKGLGRKGPGSEACTGNAFAMLPSLPEHAEILDVGCGAGAQALELARLCPGCHITALDIHQPFLEDLEARASARGIEDRITTVCASMDSLPFQENSFDLIWAEGSVYIMGFESGIRYLKRYLKKEGYLALTEVAWLTAAPSGEAREFFDSEYPGMKTVVENEEIIRRAGYETIGSFVLPASAWWDEYYLPLAARLDEVQETFRGNNEAEYIIGITRKEIELFRNHPDEYGYVFFVLTPGLFPP